MNWPMKFKPPGPDWVSTKKTAQWFHPVRPAGQASPGYKAFSRNVVVQGQPGKSKFFIKRVVTPERRFPLWPLQSLWKVISKTSSALYVDRPSMILVINFFLGGGQNHWIWKELWKVHLRFFELFPKMVRSMRRCRVAHTCKGIGMQNCT